MRTSIPAALLVVMAGTVGGCNVWVVDSGGVQEIDPVNAVANRCAVATYDQGLRAGGVNRLSNRLFLDGELAAWAGIYGETVPVFNRRGLAVAEASALDNGSPGSAWAACMQQGLRNARRV